MLNSGEALLKMVENGDNVALIVAGTDAADTRSACKALISEELEDSAEQILTF